MAVVIPQRVLDRVWDRIDQRTTDECWPWKLSLNSKGYGQIGWWAGGRSHMTSAVRAVWTSLHGPIGAGLVIDHLCRVRSCCNPNHLEPVTPLENTRRGEGPSGLAARRTHCPAGHPYSSENTRMDKRGYRVCRSCSQNRVLA